MSKFPPTQYLGSKQKLAEWIINYVPKVDTIFDAFSGSAVMSYYFKKLGATVISNDFLKSSFYYAKALVENNTVTLSDNTMRMLTVKNPKKENYIETNFSEIFYTRDECAFIDNVIANISKLKNEYEKALAYAALVRTCIRKIPGGKFRSNLLRYRDSNFKHYRPKFTQNIGQSFLKVLSNYNNYIFDNGKKNEAINKNVFDVIRSVHTTAAYFDPPYGGSGFDYEKDYFFAELLTKYYGEIHQFYGKSKVYQNVQFSGFNKRAILMQSFNKLFYAAQHIPIWIISYNNRSLPRFEEFASMIKKFKNISKVYEKDYNYKI